MKIRQTIGRSAALWGLLAQPAMALPGPEVLAPIGLGLLQVVTLLWLSLNLRKISRTLKRGLKVLLVLGLVYTSAYPLALLVSGIHNPSIISHTFSERTIPALATLPQDLSTAERAPPIPTSKHAALREGGRIVVYLGETEDYLNRQLPSGGYVLRLPDWSARESTLTSHSKSLLFLYESFITPPGGIEAIPIEDVPEVVNYQPNLPPVWDALIPKGLISVHAPDTPTLFPYPVPNIRSVDADVTPVILPIASLSTTEIQALTSTRRILLTPGYRDAASAVGMLTRSGRPPVAFTQDTQSAPLRLLRLGAADLLLLCLAGLLASMVAERRTRRWRNRALADRMRQGLGPSHAADGAWVLTPLAPAAVLCTLAAFSGLTPDLWEWNSPPVYTHTPWIATLLTIVTCALWVARSRGLPQRYRRGCSAAGALVLGAFLVTGELYLGHLALPLSICASCLAGILVAPKRGTGWAFSRVAVPSAGSKAADLARAIAHSEHVAEGLVLWPQQLKDPAKTIEQELGPGPYILRSSATQERDSFGTHKSVIVEANEVAHGLSQVLESYGDQEGSAVLCMPLIVADHSGVARVDLSGVDTDIGASSDGITGGESLLGSAHWHRYSQDSAADTRFTIMQVMQSWPHHKRVLLEWVGPWIVQSTDAPTATNWWSAAWDCLARHEIDAASLTRIGEESLPSPCGDRTLAFWEQAWRRDGALGHAARRLGIPRFLVPEQAVFSIGGGLYVHEQLWHLVERVLWFRSQLPGWNAEARLKTIWSTVNANNMQGLIRDSIALRLLQPHLPDGAVFSTPAPSTCLGQSPEDFPHRATHDLDFATPRQGESIGPEQPLAPLPATRTQSACAYLRDWVHDAMCRHIAQMQKDDPSWLDQTPLGDPPTGTMTVVDIEKQSEGTIDGSVWIGAAEDVEGTVSSEPGPGRILFVDTPRPEHIRTGFEFIVCRGGSRFSHAALVCSQRGIKALFGTGVTLQDGDTVHINKGGQLVQRTTAEHTHLR